MTRESNILSILLVAFCLLNHCSCGIIDVFNAAFKHFGLEKHPSEPIRNENRIKAEYIANAALKHIDAKYRHPRQMKVISILIAYSVPPAHYIIEMEVGDTDCLALWSEVDNCNLVTDMGDSKICRIIQSDEECPSSVEVSCNIDEKQIDVNKNAQAEILFKKFLNVYKPSYLNNPKEMRIRLDIFKRNIEKMHEINTYECGTARYGVTKFADLTDEEFHKKHLGLKPRRASSNLSMTKAKIPNVTLPDSFDWRDAGAVTDVKDQGICGACWAFSVTGNIEGLWKVKSGQLVSLSEQQLLDCDSGFCPCGGRQPADAFSSIVKFGGLETEEDYPYKAKSNLWCKSKKCRSKVRISGSTDISSDEDEMAKWMVENGPMSAQIDASNSYMQYYHSGVAKPSNPLCGLRMNHAILIVGYGIEWCIFGSTPFWIIKNSWGTSWGESGYYRLHRGAGSCGINDFAMSAVIN